MGFAERTGLTAARPPQRYLWTDAFAVCNFLGLAHATGEPRYTELALQLVASRAPRARSASRRRPPHRLDQRAQRRARRSPSDARRPPDRQAAARAHARRALRRATRVGARRPVLPLPHEVDARARSGDARDRPDDVQRVGARAGPRGAPCVHVCAARRRPQADVLEAEHRSVAPAGRRRWASTIRSTASSPARSSRRPVAGARAAPRRRDRGLRRNGRPARPRDRRTLSASAACSATHTASCSSGSTVRAAEGWSSRCSRPPSRVSGTTSQQPDLRMPAGRRLAFRELGLAIGLAAIEADAWRGASPGVRARCGSAVPLPVAARRDRGVLVAAGASPGG